MTLAEMLAEFELKAFGPNNVTNLTPTVEKIYLNRGYNRLYPLLTKKDEIGLALFGTISASLSPTAGDYLLPLACDRLIRVENTTQDQVYIQKPLNQQVWTQITTGTIYISYINPLEVLGSTPPEVTTPSISVLFHHTIVDFAVAEYFLDLGGGYTNDAKKWLGIAQSGAEDALKGIYWNLVAKTNEVYNPSRSLDNGFYYVNVGLDATTGKRKIRIYNA